MRELLRDLYWGNGHGSFEPALLNMADPSSIRYPLKVSHLALRQSLWLGLLGLKGLSPVIPIKSTPTYRSQLSGKMPISVGKTMKYLPIAVGENQTFREIRRFRENRKGPGR
jgi:hypothetical protein